jgi:hypothetical protein
MRVDDPGDPGQDDVADLDPRGVDRSQTGAKFRA